MLAQVQVQAAINFKLLGLISIIKHRTNQHAAPKGLMSTLVIYNRDYLLTKMMQ